MEQGSLSGILFDWPDPEVIVLRSGPPVRLTCKLVQTSDALAEMRDFLMSAPEVSYDTETSGLAVHHGARIVGHALAAKTGPSDITAWYVPIRHTNFGQEEQQLDVYPVSMAVSQVLRAPGDLVGQHTKFDLLMARADGITTTRRVHDVSIAAIIHDENEPRFGLKPLSEKYVCVGAEAEEAALTDWLRKDARSLKLAFRKRGRGDPEAADDLGEPTYLERFGYSRAPIKLLGRYACKDVFYPLILRHGVFADVERQYPKVYEREHAIAPLLGEMEWIGLPVDADLIRAIHDKTGEEVRHWLAEVRRIVADPEFGATDTDIRTLLYEKLKLTAPKKTKDEEKGSVDAETRGLLAESNPEHAALFSALAALSDARKLHGTYSGNFLRYVSPETNAIHPAYNQLEQRDEGGVPVTGRLSSQSPNIQNIQTRIIKLRDGTEVSVRRYFRVPDGCLYAYIDFNQIELRVLAWFSRDPTLLHAYANGLDVHSAVAVEMDVERRISKQINFGIPYGLGIVGLAKRMPGYYQKPKETQALAKTYLVLHAQRYPRIYAWRSEFACEMRRNHCMFVNPFGRPRRIPDIASPMKWVRERAERQATSSIISGTAADIMKESMLRCAAVLREHCPEGALVQSIHDELVFRLPRQPGWVSVVRRLVGVMEDWPQFAAKGTSIKVAVDISKTTWEDKQRLTLLPDGRVELSGK